MYFPWMVRYISWLYTSPVLSIQNINLNVLFLLSFQFLFIVLAVVAVVYYHHSAIRIFIAISLPCMCVYVEGVVRTHVCVCNMCIHVCVYMHMCVYIFLLYPLLFFFFFFVVVFFFVFFFLILCTNVVSVSFPSCYGNFFKLNFIPPLSLLSL